MDSPGSSGKLRKISSYMKQEAKKVQAFISELKIRLNTIRHEEERITQVSATLLKKHNPEYHSHKISSVELQKIQQLRKEVWENNDPNFFQDTLKKFQTIQNTSLGLLNSEDREELRNLRNQNLSIKKRIQKLKSFIEETKNTKNTNDETCTQLYVAANQTLEKIMTLDNDIISFESIILSQVTSEHKRLNIPMNELFKSDSNFNYLSPDNSAWNHFSKSHVTITSEDKTENNENQSTSSSKSQEQLLTSNQIFDNSN